MARKVSTASAQPTTSDGVRPCAAREPLEKHAGRAGHQRYSLKWHGPCHPLPVYGAGRRLEYREPFGGISWLPCVSRRSPVRKAPWRSLNDRYPHLGPEQSESRFSPAASATAIRSPRKGLIRE